MSLPVSEQRTLDLIDDELAASTPQLASMFGIFTRLSSDDGPAVAEELRPSRLRAVIAVARTFVLIPVAIAMVVAGLMLGGTGRGVSHPRPPGGVVQLAVPGR